MDKWLTLHPEEEPLKRNLVGPQSQSGRFWRRGKSVGSAGNRTHDHPARNNNI